jgi:cell division protein FtsN
VATARPKITSRDYKRARANAFSLDDVRWREFGAGLAIGLALACGVHLYHTGAAARKQAETRTSRAESRADASEAGARNVAAAAADETANDYDFYDMLPKFEVVVPESDKEVRSDRDDTLGTIGRPGVYVLQAGSYRDVEEADRIRAQLKKQGIDAAVQRVAVDDDVWHRVRVGPITDLKELNRLRSKLQAAELDALVIRVGE